MEHLEKIPFLLSLFLPIIIFFLFGLWIARMSFRGDHKRLKRAVEENDHLAADLTRALAPEKDMSKSLLGRIEDQKAGWALAIKTAQDELFTEKCRTRDLRNQLSAQQGTTSPSDSNFEEILVKKDETIATLQAEIERMRQASAIPVQTSLDLASDDVATEEDSNYGLVYPTRPSEIDDLKKIKGLGKAVEDKLHTIGVYRFAQIASWNSDQIQAVERHLALKNRITRDQWTQQASQLQQG